MAFEAVLEQEKPDLVVVVGDVNSTMAATLVASKLDVPVAHVEAGLRSFDRTMPEEINRLVTDAIADLLLTPSRDGDANLIREGVDPRRIRFVGNVMIDSLLKFLPRARADARLGTLRPGPRRLRAGDAAPPLERGRPRDARPGCCSCSGAWRRSCRCCSRSTRGRRRWCRSSGCEPRKRRLQLADPIGYLDFIALEDGARLVLTDSGGSRRRRRSWACRA